MTEPKQIAAVSNEPVAWLYSHKYHDKVFAEADRADMDPQYWTETPLYAHPPTVERETNRIDITPSLLLCRMNDQLAAKDARIDYLLSR